MIVVVCCPGLRAMDLVESHQSNQSNSYQHFEEAEEIYKTTQHDIPYKPNTTVITCSVAVLLLEVVYQPLRQPEGGHQIQYPAGPVTA